MHYFALYKRVISHILLRRVCLLFGDTRATVRTDTVQFFGQNPSCVQAGSPSPVTPPPFRVRCRTIPTVAPKQMPSRCLSRL